LAGPRDNILAILARPKAARPKEPGQDNLVSIAFGLAGFLSLACRLVPL
jgi:hypothetical protein